MNTNQKQCLFQIFSIDVVLGALAVGFFATKLLKVTPTPWWWIILPIAVWVVYTFDHLVDGFKRKGESVIYRHSFHYQKRKILFTLITFSGIWVSILAVIFLDTKIIVGGVILGLLVLFYLGFNFINKKSHILFFQKELFIAAIYVSGIFLAPIIWYGQPLNGEKLTIFLILIALAFAESAIISWFDYEEDRKDSLSSFAVNFGKTKTRKMMSSFLTGLLLLILLCSWFFHKEHLPFMLILMMMDLVLLIIIRKPNLFEKNHLFRWIGESVFYLPALVYFFSP